LNVLIAVQGTHGDVHPMLALARYLLRAGHRVRLAAPPDFAAECNATGAECVVLGPDMHALLAESATALERGGLDLVRRVREWARTTVDEQFRVLPHAVDGMDFVLSAGPVFAAASAAELAHVPFRFVAYAPAMLPAAAHTPAFLPFQTRRRWLNRLLWRSCASVLDLIARREINRARGRLGLREVATLRTQLLSERPLLAADAPLASAPHDCELPFDQIRCLHPFDGDPLPDTLERFLECGPAPIYIGFGSIPDPRPQTTTQKLLTAIERNGCRAILSRGWAGLGDGLLSERVLAIGSVSHARLFPRCALIVHHGGAGTTHTAARAGVPQLLVPHLADQYYFARRVEELGVGRPAIARRKLTADVLLRRWRETLEDGALALRARELGERLAELGPIEPDWHRVFAR
jgi:vancomycin aglycone glucosyltransferase